MQCPTGHYSALVHPSRGLSQGNLQPPGEERVRKGGEKFALGGNAKFWQQATWSPYKTATCIVSLLYASHLGGTGEERKAGRRVNTRRVMSWKSWTCFAASIPPPRPPPHPYTLRLLVCPRNG